MPGVQHGAHTGDGQQIGNRGFVVFGADAHLWKWEYPVIRQIHTGNGNGGEEGVVGRVGLWLLAVGRDGEKEKDEKRAAHGAGKDRPSASAGGTPGTDG